MTRLKWVGLAFGVLLVFGTGAVVYGSWRWEKATEAMLTRLKDAQAIDVLHGAILVLIAVVEVDVAWVTPEGIKPYYRGKVTSLSFEYEPS